MIYRIIFNQTEVNRHVLNKIGAEKMKLVFKNKGLEKRNHLKKRVYHRHFRQSHLIVMSKTIIRFENHTEIIEMSHSITMVF